jgi:hypothetical protein
VKREQPATIRRSTPICRSHRQQIGVASVAPFADARAMKTVKSTIVPRPELAE